MSQLNVDTIGGQTGTTISVASGHSFTGANLVKLVSTTASNDAAIIFDNIVDHSKYINYFIFHF